MSDFSQGFTQVFRKAFPRSEYPVLNALFEENRKRKNSGALVSSDTETFIAVDMNEPMLRTAKAELEQKWSDEEFESRADKHFNRAAILAEFKITSNSDLAKQVFENNPQYNERVLVALQSAREQKRDQLLALVSEKLSKATSFEPTPTNTTEPTNKSKEKKSVSSNETNNSAEMTDLTQFDPLFSTAFPPNEYPVLTELWDENKSGETNSTLISQTETFITDEANEDVLRTAETELSERWTDDNVAKRVNETFTDKALNEIFQAENGEEQKKINEQVRGQIIDTLQTAIADTKDSLSALVETTLSDKLPWYDRKWQGLELKYWAAIGGAVVLIIIILIATGGKKAYDYYAGGPMMPAPVAPQYQPPAGYGYGYGY